MKANYEEDKIIVSATEPTGDNRRKVWMQKGKNLFNKNKLFTEYRIGSDGVLFADSAYSATDFIQVKPNTTYIVNWAIETRECVCYYDETKTFISRNTSTNPFTIPENCKYIRVSRLSTGISTAQIECGTKSTAYEEYIEPAIYVKNDNDVYEEFMRKKDVNDLIVTQVFKSSEITVNTNTNVYSQEISVAKVGYEAIGILFVDTSSNCIVVAKTSLYNNIAYIGLLNYSGSSQTTTITIRVLYRKTTD